jgi:hypothetical protein
LVEKGDQGDTGVAGDQGDTGTAGAKGDTGDQGDTGADGTLSTWVNLTDGATINLDLALGANRKFRVTIAGNRILTFSNPLLGQVFTLRATQDENGNRALTFPSGITWAGGEVPDQPKVANTTDSYIFICTNTETPAYDGYVLGNEMAVPA